MLITDAIKALEAAHKVLGDDARLFVSVLGDDGWTKLGYCFVGPLTVEEFPKSMGVALVPASGSLEMPPPLKNLTVDIRGLEHLVRPVGPATRAAVAADLMRYGIDTPESTQDAQDVSFDKRVQEPAEEQIRDRIARQSGYVASEVSK